MKKKVRTFKLPMLPNYNRLEQVTLLRNIFDKAGPLCRKKIERDYRTLLYKMYEKRQGE